MFVFVVVDNCQRRWRNLRENYVKSHKKKPSGSGADGKKCGHLDIRRVIVPGRLCFPPKVYFQISILPYNVFSDGLISLILIRLRYDTMR